MASYLLDSIVSLGYAVIMQYHNEDQIVPERNLYPELFEYDWTLPTINLLRKILIDTRARSEFYRRQYISYYNVVYEGDSHLLFLLLKYGFLQVNILEEYPIIKYDASEEPINVIALGTNWAEYRMGTRENFFRIFQPQCHLQFKRKLQNYTCVSPVRLWRVLWGLRAVMETKIGPHTHCKVRCIKTFYEFAREPYITRAEIEDIVKCIGGEHISDIIVGQIGDTFEYYFPEGRQNYQPRKLKHLTLCQIREILYRNEMFPRGVSQLKLPKTLKESIVTIKPSLTSETTIQLFSFVDRPTMPFELMPRRTNVTRSSPYLSSRWWQAWT